MNTAKRLSPVVIGIGFIIAGLNHFLNTDFYVAIMPPAIPYHLELVYLSGVFEIVGGVGLLILRLRKVAGWGLILLLFAVFPANIHMALNSEQYADIAPVIVLYLRLPLQFVLMGWVYWSIRD